MQEKEGRMTMSELRAQVINLLQDAWELGYECGAKDVSSARTVTLDALPDAELAEHGLVRLPVDADGVRWTGTEQYAEFNGRKYIVDGIRLDERGWAVMAIDLNGALWRAPSAKCRHVKDEPEPEPTPDTPASLADELDALTVRGFEDDELHDLADRLRAIGGEE